MLYEVDAKMITERGGIDEGLIGGNASAEGGDEGTDDGSVSGVDIILANRLASTAFDKKTYTTYIKGYLKAILKKLEASNPDRVADFQKNSAVAVKRILGNFKNYEFYTGESMNPDGMCVLLDYREDGITPYLTFFRDGLKEQKC